MVIRLKGIFLSPKEVLKRRRTNFDLEDYRNKVKTIGWSTMYSVEDINIAYHIFESNILDIFEYVMPMTKV